MAATLETGPRRIFREIERLEPRSLRNAVPILTWLPAYQRGWLRADVIAGATLWGFLIPEMIAYAGLAGMPAQAGLYTLIASLSIYAVFGTGKHVAVAGTSASAALLAVTVAELKPADTDEYVKFAATLILFVGALFVIAGFARLGFITQFLSRPVMAGFMAGLALFVIVSQLPKLFGIAGSDGNTVEQFWHLVRHIGDADGPTTVIGISFLVGMVALARFVPRVPGGLVVLVAGIFVGWAFSVGDHGVAIVGNIPGGLPELVKPDTNGEDLWVMFPAAIGILLVNFSQGLGTAQAFATKYNYEVRASQEMVATGFANLGSGVLGGLPVGGSLSSSAVNEQAGAKTLLSSLIAAALALVTVVALTPIFTDLPEPVLAALVIAAVYRMLNVRELWRFYKLSPVEFWLGIATLLGVMLIDVLPGLLIGVVISLLLVIFRISWPRIAELGPGPGGYQDVQAPGGAGPTPGLLIVRPDAPIFYANASLFCSRIKARVESAATPIHAAVLDLDGTDTLDITSAEELERLVKWLQAHEVAIAFAHVHSATRDMLEKSGLSDTLGEERIFVRLEAAVDFVRPSTASG